VVELHERGLDTAYLYGVDESPEEQLAGNLGAFFLLTDPPERFGLPAQADSPAQENGPPATAAGLVAAAVAAGSAVVTLVVHHRKGRR
jgi:formate dehydrogenase iron-sulfur subunit